VPPPAPPGLLQEVVVTATRQAELLNQVPISLTAATQRTLDQLGVRQVADMQTVTPALVFSQLTPGVANVAVRGITDTGSGAATTGFYLDDTPLQKRNAGGVRNGSGNGTPLPPLFDVERIEVLRGPQGTLFGAGSEGGTIRFISPQPSLTRPAAYLRAEASTTARGGPSHEAGVAFGAPIVEDRLGFRLSLFQRHTGGFLDYIDPYTDKVRFKDANDGRSRLLRLQVLWAPTERLKATFALTTTSDRWGSATSAYTPSMPAAIVTPTLCFNTTGITPAASQNSPAPVPCNTPGVTFVRPGIAYGPFPALGPGRTLARDRTPSSTNLRVPSLTLDYAFDGMTARSVTSYISDQTRYLGIDNLSQIRDSRSNATYGDIYIPRGLTLAGDYPDAWRTNGHFYSLNRRYGISQELRFASAPETRPVSWVAGVFYSNLRTRQGYDNVYEGLEQLAHTLFGLSAEQRYGVPAYGIHGVPVGFDHKDQAFQDVEIAGFGEINIQATDRLKLIAGVRVSRLSFTYVEHHYGPASGFNVPTAANGGGPNEGDTTEAPVAPKVGAQYRFSDDDMVYVTAAKGFRAGGVNANLPTAICGAGLAQYGLEPDDVPATYQSDKVWSYEAGAKLRLLNGRLQLNGAAYRIDWTNAQITIDVGNNCGIPFIGNAGTARSQGIEVEAQAKVGRRLTADFALGYDDVRYTEDAVAVRAGSAPLIVAVKDQRLSIPPLTLRVGGRYDFEVMGLKAYARADWYYTQGYDRAAQQTYGLPAYAPDAVIQDARRANIRLGIERGGVEASVFANNLFNSSAGMITGGRSGCALPVAGGDAACRSYGTYNPFLSAAPAASPRQVGIQVTYRR
jgi:outer membrane receptor protein involved in Fe transport